MHKTLLKIRSFLIRSLAGKNTIVIINADIDSKKGIVVNKDYIIMREVNVEGFDTCFTIEAKQTHIDNKNVSCLDKQRL